MRRRNDREVVPAKQNIGDKYNATNNIKQLSVASASYYLKEPENLQQSIKRLASERESTMRIPEPCPW